MNELNTNFDTFLQFELWVGIFLLVFIFLHCYNFKWLSTPFNYARKYSIRKSRAQLTFDQLIRVILWKQALSIITFAYGNNTC